MNIVDLVIVGLIILGGVLGFLRGFFRELVSAVGFIVAAILAFLFKSPVSSFLYSHLPFFKFGSILKGAPVLNILLYEILAFLIMLALFMLILKIVKMATRLVEIILNLTIILGIPSKILGAIVGVIHYYVITFILLYVLSLPFISFKLLETSTLKDKILNDTPVFSSMVKEKVSIIDEFIELKDKYNDTTNEQFNNESVDLMLKYKIVSVETMDNLIEQKKISVDSSIIDKYREE